MNDIYLITSESGNKYLYAGATRYSFYIPDDFVEAFDNEDKDSESYYQRKLRFFHNNGLLDNEKIKVSSKYIGEQVLKNLANLRQLLIEVTDGCNLRCKYCGYGEFYSNHDERRGINLNFENVKVVIDFLYDLWKSEYNISANNIFSIGFYGGEPLLNMKLIQEVISYVEGLKTNGIVFSYNMTTNGVLLDRYGDFLAQKEFRLLISLDGDEYGNSYRVNHQGKESFHGVIANIHRLKEKHPEYFEKHVSFNAVLHDRNSVAQTVRFVHDTFGKHVRMAELNTLGIADEKKDKFARMFKEHSKSYADACADEHIVELIGNTDDKTMLYHSMLISHCGNQFMNYSDLFDNHAINKEYLPTATCKPFEKKLFVTVNGKILPCEKIGQEQPLGKLENGILHLDCNEIAHYYSQMFEEVKDSCKNCQAKRNCGQCMYFIPKRNGCLSCQSIMTRKHKQVILASFYSYAENNPQKYHESLSTIKIS